MPSNTHTTCDTCNTDYEFSKSNTVAYVYPDAIANHLLAKCPKGHQERIFVTWNLVSDLVTKYHVEAKVVPATPAFLLAIAKRAWKVEDKPEPGSEAAKRAEQMQLWRSPRREKHIDSHAKFFAYLLERGEMP